MYIKSFPNNQDVEQGAEDVMRWLHGRTSGVFGADGNAAVTAMDTPAMAVQVSDGVGWITNNAHDGVVWWNDNLETTGAQMNLSIDLADGVLNRIDRVIVEWKTVGYVDYPEIKVLKGTATSKAQAPALTNNSTIRQLSLAQIYIAAGTTEITPGMITDERLDESVCGIVTDGISIDTTTMQAQFKAFLAGIELELKGLEAGTGVEMAKLKFTGTTVQPSAFSSDSTYTDYPYRAAVTLSGVMAGMVPDVVFSLAAMIENDFAPVSECYNGGVYIYASSVPESAITISTIICWR